MDTQLYAVWPVCHVKDIERHRYIMPARMDYETALELGLTLPGKFALRCSRCRRVHWFSYTVGRYERAIVGAEKRKMEDFAKQSFDQLGHVGQVSPFDNRGGICPKMHVITLSEYRALMERETGKGIGGRLVF